MKYTFKCGEIIIYTTEDVTIVNQINEDTITVIGGKKYLFLNKTIDIDSMEVTLEFRNKSNSYKI